MGPLREIETRVGSKHRGFRWISGNVQCCFQGASDELCRFAGLVWPFFAAEDLGLTKTSVEHVMVCFRSVCFCRYFVLVLPVCCSQLLELESLRRESTGGCQTRPYHFEGHGGFAFGCLGVRSFGVRS